MSDEADDPALAIGVAAALARQYSEDARTFLIGLAVLLENALPGEVTVRRAGLFGTGRPVKRIEATLTAPDGAVTRYRLEDAEHGPLTATRTRIVREIALKTEPIAADQWIAEVGAAVAERARHSKSARDALKTLS